MGDGPEKEQDTRGRQKRRHDVHANGHLRGVVRKLGEEVARQHKERGTRRVTDFQLESRGDKLWTVPETCRGLNR